MMGERVGNVLAEMDKMQLEDVREVLAYAQSLVDEREKRFAELVAQFYEALDSLQTEFTQAHIPLQVSPDEMLDAMDYMVPKDYMEKAKIGA